MSVIKVNGKVVRTRRGPVWQYGYDVRDVVLGKELGFLRRVHTCRRMPTEVNSVGNGKGRLERWLRTR